MLKLTAVLMDEDVDTSRWTSFAALRRYHRNMRDRKNRIGIVKVRSSASWKERKRERGGAMHHLWVQHSVP